MSGCALLLRGPFLGERACLRITLGMAVSVDKSPIHKNCAASRRMTIDMVNVRFVPHNVSIAYTAMLAVTVVDDLALELTDAMTDEELRTTIARAAAASLARAASDRSF